MPPSIFAGLTAGANAIGGFLSFTTCIYFFDYPKKISTHLLPWSGWFCPVVSEPVEPYFTRFLRVLSFCLGVSNGVAFGRNGVVK